MHESQKSTGLTNELLSDNAGAPQIMSKEILSYWHGHFKGWEKSGLSQAAYCLSERLNLGSYGKPYTKTSDYCAHL